MCALLCRDRPPQPFAVERFHGMRQPLQRQFQVIVIDRPRPRCRRAAVTARRMLAIIASRPLRDAALIIWSGPMRSCGCRSSRRSPRLTSRCSRTAPARSPCAASKTDQEGRGHVRYLGPPTVAAVNRWPQAAGISAGPLFRRVRRGDVMGTKPLERAQRPGDRRQASDRRRHHRAGVRALTPARLGPIARRGRGPAWSSCNRRVIGRRRRCRAMVLGAETIIYRVRVPAEMPELVAEFRRRVAEATMASGDE